MSSGNNIYTYTPLRSGQPPSIRLLTLDKAGKFGDEIRCKVWETSLDNDDEFEALSYIWGSTSLDVMSSISIVDDEKDYSFQVTNNLENALRHLRLADRNRVLWIDAICINQKDDEEKGQQIAQMRLIYTTAKRVVLWMGEEGDTKIALGHMKRLKKAHEADTVLRKAMFKGMPPAEAIQKKEAAFPRRHQYFRLPILFRWYEREWSACDALLDRPWWTRSWTLQEVIHTGEVQVYFGRLEIQIDDLCEMIESYLSTRATREMFRRPLKPPTVPYNINFDMEMSSVSSISASPGKILTCRSHAKDAASDPNNPYWPMRLGGLLLLVRDQQAKEKRDKIWAFVGIAPHGHDLDARKHYTKLSWEELYIRVAHSCLERTLLPLLFVESPERSMSNSPLPSWVPDHTQRQTLIPQKMVTSWQVFSADKDFPGVEREPRKLLFEAHGHTPELTLRGIEVGSITHTKIMPILEGLTPEGNDTKLKIFKYVSQVDGSDGQPLGENASFRNTSWGPLNAEWGDIIIISPGSVIPLVLRRDGGRYRFVGGCWLIIRELQDLTQEDPGFSDIMFGNLGVDKESRIKEFVIF